MYDFEDAFDEILELIAEGSLQEALDKLNEARQALDTLNNKETGE